jgi:hypothetical protein
VSTRSFVVTPNNRFLTLANASVRNDIAHGTWFGTAEAVPLPTFAPPVFPSYDSDRAEALRRPKASAFDICNSHPCRENRCDGESGVVNAARVGHPPPLSTAHLRNKIVG